jgi:hypothetical protein
MTGESTIFAAQFADMFNKFVKQQLDFQKKVEKSFNQIAKNTSTADKSKNNNHQNYQGELGKFNAKEKKEQSSENPRKVKEGPIPVTLVDISKEAAKALKNDDNYNIVNKLSGGKGGGSGLGLGSLITSLLGGSLLGLLKNLLLIIGVPALGAFLNRFFDMKKFVAGLGLTSAIPKITSMLSSGVGKLFSKVKLGEKITEFFSAIKGFKFLQPFLKPLKTLFGPLLGAAKVTAKVGGWLFRRLPGLGFLISLGIGMDKIVNQDGKTIEGLLDIASGIAYMFPGIGTVIGLGIDALNWLMHSEDMGDDSKADFANLKRTPIQFKSFGDIFRQGLYSFKEGQQNVKGLFAKMGMQFSDFAKDPSLGTFIPFAESLFGSYNPFVMAMKFLNGDPVLTDLENATLGITGQIIYDMLVNPVISLITNILSKVSDDLSESFGLLINAWEEDHNTWQGDMKINSDAKKEAEELQKTLNEENVKFKPYKEWSKDKGYSKNITTERGEMFFENPNYYQGYLSYLQQEREKVYQENARYIFPDPESQMLPLNNNSTQPEPAPSKKEDDVQELLKERSNEISNQGYFSQLLDATNEQNKMMAAMLNKNTSNNVVAPSTTNNYTFNVESGVNAFRKALA